MNHTTHLPFEVSARTARLIGRENIASSRGAIIELVKNAYDADSNLCIVYFDIKAPSMKKQFQQSEIDSLVNLGISKEHIFKLYRYEKTTRIYELKADLDESVRSYFKDLLSKYNSLLIIDSGEGMTQDIIRNNWMTIGTDSKLISQKSKKGRIKTGAKGIGRFALDKLGRNCEMITVFNPDAHSYDTNVDGQSTNFTGYSWKVNWNDFEGAGKVLNQVTASLSGMNAKSLSEEVKRLLPDFVLEKVNKVDKFEYGTILKITGLRDDWMDVSIRDVYSDLEVLVPEKESQEFKIYLFHSASPDLFGAVEPSICEDYDYKLVAKADSQQNVLIKLYRREFDAELIPSDFFDRPSVLKSALKRPEFSNLHIEKKTNFRILLPGFNEINHADALSRIGEFEFTFYYLKRNYNERDAKRFFYKSFKPNLRKQWLNKFGGLKLYRDGFWIRPYGEIKSSAFDWLSLGNRKATSPAGVARGDSSYKVEPENIAGIIKISRIKNEFFQDKSSREGLQENDVFQVFKSLLIAIINVFESDRSLVASELAAFESMRNPQAKIEKAINALTKELINDSLANNVLQDLSFTTPETTLDRGYKILAYGLNQIIKQRDDEIERLMNEQQLLRGLATAGLVLASFSHDLAKMSDILSKRMDNLRNNLVKHLNIEKFSEVERRKNPFLLIESIKENDLKLQYWLNFSIGVTRKDKRRRKNIKLRTYLNALKADWSVVLEERGIKLLCDVDGSSIKIFEIDLDSIFSNLIVNSIDAFSQLTVERERTITIKVKNIKNKMSIYYHDNATGLSKDIMNPDDIFMPMFTTKRDPITAEIVGTGLGLWILKAIVNDYKGSVNLLNPEIGFGILIVFGTINEEIND